MKNEMSKKFGNNQRGVSLYYAVVITSLLLAIALGLGTILISQIRGLKEMGDSVMALFAADTGMEYILYLDIICQKEENCSSTSPFYELCYDQANLAYEAGFIPTTTCMGLFYYTTSTDLAPDWKFVTSVTTTAEATVFRCSRGIYKETQRAIESTRIW